MLINFLDPKLSPRIVNEPPSTENYEAENLLSASFSEKRRGFIAFPSIKPPIELEFRLMCNANISHIYLNASVGGHKCSGIEIFAKNGNNSYVSIGRAVNNNGPESMFCNGRIYSVRAPPPNYDKTNCCLYFFKRGTFRAFLNASFVKIVIFRTEKCVPCLGDVQIWGAPSKSCPQSALATINKLTMKNAETVQKVEPKVFKIPDEFKDDLTYELMTIPYTLPSGKTIDLTTLEKHEESEKSFGRKPGDPFTGIKFTDSLRPILNVGLKSRIDMFLLKNSDEPATFYLKRSLSRPNKRFKNDPEATSSGSTNNTNDELDSLISKAMSGPDFVSFFDKASEFACAFCENDLECFLYRLPCEHRSCRKCLLDICKESLCRLCKKPFSKSQIVKVNK